MGSAARRMPVPISVEEFLVTDQAVFGPAWRYELIDGQPVAQASPSPEHAAIIVNLGAALKPLLAGWPCRAEAGSAAIPRHKSNDRARVPDLMVRCSGKPTVLFEVVSPSDERSQAEKAERYRDLRNVDGVQEIVEVEQDEFVCRVHRLRSEIDGWQMDYVSGADSTLHVASLGISVSLRVIYEDVLTPEPPPEVEEAASDNDQRNGANFGM